MDDDLLGRREVGRRLGIALAVAMLVAVVLWNTLECERVQRWIWSFSGWGRIESALDWSAVGLVFATYVGTFAALGVREKRRWHARVPAAVATITRSR